MRYLILVAMLAGCAPPPELKFSDYEGFCANGCADRHRECVQGLNPLIGDEVVWTCRRAMNECLEKCPRESK